MRTNERGAIIIHVAIALMALLCFAGIVLDQGVFLPAPAAGAERGRCWGARRRDHEFSSTRAPMPTRRIAAKALANQNAVWGQVAATATSTVTRADQPARTAPNGLHPGRRLRGLPDPAQRHGTHEHVSDLHDGNAGRSTPGRPGTATAQVAAGNAVRVHQAVGRRRQVDGHRASTGTDPSAAGIRWTFDPGDTYTPGTQASQRPVPANDYGLQLVLKQGIIGTWSSGWTMEIDLGVQRQQRIQG